MGGGAWADIDWVGHGRGPLGRWLARRRAIRQVLKATEAELNERGLPIEAQRSAVQRFRRWLANLWRSKDGNPG
jgi:hypothetical protein